MILGTAQGTKHQRFKVRNINHSTYWNSSRRINCR